jgi:hypothetical protein
LAIRFLKQRMNTAISKAPRLKHPLKPVVILPRRLNIARNCSTEIKEVGYATE